MSKPLGFEKKHKVRKKSDFLKLRKNSRKFVARHWIVFFQKNGLEHPRLAVSISTSFGNSVRRNYCRRLLREQFRQKKASLPAIDVHFVMKRKAPGLSRAMLRDELYEDFERFLHWLS